MPVVPDDNVFVVLSTDKTELVSKKVAGPLSGFVSMSSVGVPNWKGGSPGWRGLRDREFLRKICFAKSELDAGQKLSIDLPVCEGIARGLMRKNLVLKLPPRYPDKNNKGPTSP